ncbi:MAG TPA: DUF2442 domain-containing protein [Psychromonas hadalis]|nr:DUF2442 domain-containing protein [Psychromonas hadalis]
MVQYLSINNVTYLHDYILNLVFSDGKNINVNFKDFIHSSPHPDIQKYKNIEEFKNFQLDYGDLEWNDYELAFPIFDLYQNNLKPTNLR